MKTAILYRDELKNYDFGEGHPFRGERFRIFMDFFARKFSPYRDRFELLRPTPAEDKTLRMVHTREYIDAVQAASDGKTGSPFAQYLSADNVNPLTGKVPRGIETAARLIVGSSMLAGELAAAGTFSPVIGLGGGLHHARRSYGEGFCFYNDVAVAVEHLKQQCNLKRILVLDTDAHAGNGTKEIFYADSSVLFIDIHQDPRTLYPGSGFISETGSGKGTGFTVNLPLSPGAAEDAYAYLFEEVVFPLTAEFRPEVLVRYGGSDPHYLDDLTRLGLTVEGFRMIGGYTRRLSREFCGGRSFDLMASGYNQKVLPFCWSGLLAGLLDLEVSLDGLEETNPPPKNRRLNDARDMVDELKRELKKYWHCLSK